MSTLQSRLMATSKFVTIAIVTCMVALGGMWYRNRPSKNERGLSTYFSPAHWMFWVTGRDLEKELRNPTPVFDPGHQVVPAWNSGQVNDFARYMNEEQKKRDQLMEEIRARWGPN